MTDTQTRVDTLPGDGWWEDGALRAVETLAATGRVFTAADVAELIPEPDHPCRWGSLFAKAQTLKLIESAGITRSRRRSRNGGYCQQWRAAA